jgi:protein involved in polysaccharide export with SLBB domain
MARAYIEVVIVGAVERVGALRLEVGSTLRAALEAAGGLAYRRDARPEGPMLLRRRAAASRQARVQRWNLFEDEPQSWQSAPLEHHDVIVIAWSLQRTRPS